MATMLSRTYAAFKSAGVSDEEAREAAEEIAKFENRPTRIEVMVGISLAVSIVVLAKLFSA